MNVFISGHAGFVGSHFAQRLLADGHVVSGADIKLGYDLRDYVKDHDCDQYDLIIHCAAVVGGRVKIEGDPLAVATNLSIDAEFWNWISKGKKKKRVIYFSSSAVYPTELQERNRHCALAEGLVDLTKTRFGLPDQTYGFAKFAGELLAKQAVERYGVEAVIYRPFSGYGEDQALDYPFPSIIRRVANHEDPITIWGSGDQERDFIHIDDVVEAVLATYDVLPAGATLNLGTGNGISFRRLVELACVVAGHKADIVTDETKSEGVFSRIADIYEMEKWYKPRISLVDGIKRTLTAFKP